MFAYIFADKHAPSKKKLVKQSHNQPWFNTKIRNEIKLRRKKERDWNRDQTEYSCIAFVYQRKYVSNLIRSAQKAYYHQQFEEIRYDLKKVLQLANKLLFRKVDLLLPQNYNANALAVGFNNFFMDKIDKIMENLWPTQDRPRNELFVESQFIMEKRLESFNTIDMPTLKKIVSKAPTKSCELDPLSTKLLKQFGDVVLPMVLEIINMSIHEADVPEVLKEALLWPLLKKPGLDLVFPNYQPVSNLTFVSKLIEWVICK